MTSNSNPRTLIPPTDGEVPERPERPITLVNKGNHTLYCFGDIEDWDHREHYMNLATEMSPYFVGPMPVIEFLYTFLPVSELSLPSSRVIESCT